MKIQRLNRTVFVAALASLALLSTSGCIIIDASSWGDRGPLVKGSGQRVDETRSVEPFSAIELDMVGSAVVQVGETPSLTLSGDDNILPHIKTRVIDGKLVVEKAGDVRLKPDAQLRVTITAPSLVDLSVKGVGEFRVTGLDEENLAVRKEGIGELRLQGRVQNLSLNADGIGEVDASELEAREAVVRVSGIGGVTVNALEMLDVDASGIGDVTYVGSPKTITKHLSGIGSLNSR